MKQLSKKRKQFRVEIRREQCNKIFSSIRKSIIQINCCESFISHYTNLINQNYSAGQIISAMKEDIKFCDQSIRDILSQASAQILIMKKFQFWQTAHIQDISQLFSIMFTCLDQGVKKEKYWQPFIELITASIVQKWLSEQSIDTKVYQTVVEMHNFASDYSDYEYKTFEEQIQKVLLQKQKLQSHQTLSILFVALKSTPQNFLNTKSKRILYQIAQSIYYRNIKMETSQFKDYFDFDIEFILLVFNKKRVDPENKQLFWEIMYRVSINKINYKKILQVLKFQACQNDWIYYQQSVRTLKIIYPLLRSTQDKCTFLKIIRSIIINELCNHETIYNIYMQFFLQKIQVYLQHNSILGIFSQLVKYFTYPQQLPYQQELINCVQNLLLYHKNKLKEEVKKRFVYWLASKQHFQYNKLISILSEKELQEFYEDLESDQREVLIQV